MATQKQIDAYNAFLEKFPLEKLEKMEIDEYVIGKSKKDAFCHYVERGIEELGSCRGASSLYFGIYYATKLGRYKWHDRYSKNESENDVFEDVRKDIVLIAKCASEERFDEIDKIDFPAEAFKWKVAFLYANGDLDNKKILSIYSKDKLLKIGKKKGLEIDKKTTMSQIYEQLMKHKGDKPLLEYSNELWSLAEDSNQGAENISNMSKIASTVLEYEETIKEMLLANHNIILHGAPGTGKTYLAQKIAEELGATKEKDHFKMVQFHPSYDYTDFVEGLRPTGTDNNGNIIFSRQDGVFKKFCKKALINRKDIVEPTILVNTASYNIPIGELKEAWSSLIKDISDVNNNITLKKQDNTLTPKLVINTFVKDSAQHNNKRGDKRIAWSVDNQYCSWGYIEKVHDKCIYPNNENAYSIIQNIAKGAYYSIIWAIYNEVYNRALKIHNQSSDDENETVLVEKDKPFIFLIDEINRGDMSKIFGELFYAIDPGYRGVDGKIDTQYQNLIDKEGDDPFREGFYVPKNVYIIGTMNDIDRSVESMDFAMRRRFQFIEVTAEDRAEGMKLKYKKEGDDDYTETNAYKRMTNLNKCIISKEIGLSKAYQIGGSYFLKKVIDTDGKKKSEPITENIEFSNLWRYKLEGLLREYLRGEEEHSAKEKMKILKNAFFKDTEQESIKDTQNDGNTSENDTK